jgi:hypothetical protein
MTRSVKRRRDSKNDTNSGIPYRHSQRQAVCYDGTNSPHYFESGMELDSPSDTSSMGDVISTSEEEFGGERICYGAVRRLVELWILKC